MPLSDVVNVVVTTQNPGVTQAGFGVDLILSHSAWSSPELTRTYNGIAGVASDFAADKPEYLAANKIFSQSPSPPTIMIGNAKALKPTQRWTIGVKNVANTTKYSLRVAASNAGAWASQQADFTSDASATNDEIITGLKAAVDALAAPVVQGVGAAQFTTAIVGSAGSTQLRVTANTAGLFFGMEPLDRARLTLVQDHADPGVATSLAAIALASGDWYGLTTLFNSSALVLAAAAWVESNKKLYPVAVQDTTVPQDADSGATDVAHALKAQSYARTAPFYHPANDEFADAAEVGKFFPVQPGGDNWRLKTLAAVTVQAYTETEKTNLKDKRCNYYYVLGGANVIGGEGKVSANEYIDVIRGIDWWTARVSERVANLLIQNNKIPFTDAGVDKIEAEVRAQNTEGIEAGLIASTPPPVVTAPKVANISTADKQNRQLNNVNTTWTLAGAINKLTVNAQVLA